MIIISEQEIRRLRARLNKNTVHAVKHGNTHSTRVNKRVHIEAYYRFCDIYKFRPFPPTDWRYCQFAMHLADEGKAPGTVDNYVSTVCTTHRLAGFDAPVPNQIHFRMISDYIEKTNARPVKQAEPITEMALKVMFTAVNFDSELEAVAWTAVLVAFQGLFRGSNIGQPTRKTFDADRNFIRSDLYVKDGFLTVCVRWSKTIQTKNKIVEVPMIPNDFKEICPVRFLKRMLLIIPASPHEPLFLVRDGTNRFPLTSAQVARLIKKWAKIVGLDAKKFTTHCLRRGGLNRAHEAEVQTEDLQIMGDWRSNAYKRYIKNDFRRRVVAGKKIAQHQSMQYRV